MTSCSTPAPRLCADERCRQPLPAWHPEPYCGRPCRRRARGRERYLETRGARVNDEPAFIRRLRETVPKGQCVYCLGPLSTRQVFVCGKEPCRTAYRADHRQELRSKAKGTPGEDVETCLAAEAAVDFQNGRELVSVRLDAFRARVRELCVGLGVGGAHR